MKPRLTYSEALQSWCCHGDGITACSASIYHYIGNGVHRIDPRRPMVDIFQRRDAFKAWETQRAERALCKPC